jgi:SNF2 family DNA or RNA helicase
MVYKFITTGTIEEKIDNIISQKMKLANDIIGKNEEST